MERLKAIQNKIKETGTEGFLVVDPANVTYLSGFRGDSSYLFVTTDSCYLLTDGRYTEQAKTECFDEVQVFNWIDDERYSPKTYNYLIEKHHISTLGFESNHLSYSEYKTLFDGTRKAGLHSLEGVTEELRRIKDISEIEALSEACNISDNALNLTLPYIKQGIKEIELTARLEYNLKTSGAEDISFKTIVLCGARTSLLHGRPGQTVINKGDLILFDFGAEYNGYHADMSRVFVVGQPDWAQKELYDIIYSVQKIAVDSISEGVTGKEIDKVIRQNIPEKFLPFFYPGIGHGVGLEIHEKPFIKAEAEFAFERGMVVTVEPGIYIPGFGGVRIEDTVLVTKNGAQSLTHFPRELISV